MGETRGRVYKYNNFDLEALFEVSSQTLRNWEKKGKLRRGDIRSVCDLLVKKKVEEILEDVL